MLEKVIKKGLERADDVEVYHARSTIHSLMGRPSRIRVQSVIDQGMGIRVQVDGKIGFAFTTENGEECVDHAVSIAHSKKDEVNIEFPCEEVPAVEGLYCKETDNLSLEELVAYLDELLHLDGVEEGSLEVRTMERAILNSSGLNISEKGTFVDLSVAVHGESFVFEDVSVRSFRDLHGDALVEDLQERAKEKPLKEVDKEITSIILSPEACSLLFSILVCPAVCADNVIMKQSFLRGREGEMVACEGLSVRDDATVKGGLVSRSFDAEGYPSERAAVIERGNLVGFLHNLVTSKMLGVENTGHGFRDYRSEPIVFPSNMVMEHEEELSLERLLGETKRGIMARGVIGAYSSNYVTGEFSVTLDECSLVEGGDKKRVKNVSFGGNGIDLLKGIQCVSEERRQCAHFILPFLKICGEGTRIC